MTDRILPPVSLRAAPGSDPSPTPSPARPAVTPHPWPAPTPDDTARPALASRRSGATPDTAAAPARRGSAAAAFGATARAARLARPRGEALLSTTTRAGMLVGVSAAIYAVSLAAVAGLQSQAQADVAAQNQPAIDAVAQAKAANDALEAAIGAADARARALAAEYNSVSSDMTAYQAQFARLSTLVAQIQGSAAKLNANFKLPAVTMHGAISGGGGGGTVVVTTTSASGKP